MDGKHLSRGSAALGLAALVLCLVACSDSQDPARDRGPSDSALTPDGPPPGWDPRIGPYVRGLLVQAASSSSLSPMAWSMINQACQDRTVALQYALATATDPGGPPPQMKETALTNEHLSSVIGKAPLQIGAVNITGPLIVKQTLLKPDGTPYTMKPWEWFWPYHHVPAVKVNGVWMALDLSVSDYPIDLQQWAQKLVGPGVTCTKVDGAAYQQVWAYWNTLLGSNWDPPAEKPSPYCAYSVSEKIFAWRPDQKSEQMFDVVRTVPSTMETQLGAFQILLGQSGLPATPGEIPAIRSLYEGQTLETLCSWVQLKICGK